METRFILKCEKCGELIHTGGNVLPGIERSIRNDYSFEINVSHTVFYGVCGTCFKKRYTIELFGTDKHDALSNGER